MDLNDKEMNILRRNAEIVKAALCDLKEPSNMKTIISHIAESRKVDEKDIHGPVRDVLKTGYAYGFLNKDGLKYYVEPSDKRRRGKKSGGKKSRSRSRSRSRSKSRGKKSRSRSRRGRK